MSLNIKTSLNEKNSLNIKISLNLNIEFCTIWATIAGFKSGLYTDMILTDLQKAFDTVNHNILMTKMEFIGFSEETNKWFKSSPLNRTFIVD